MRNRPQVSKNQSIKNPLERFLIWLSTADSDVLEECPKWERLKYAAFGASLLVPFLFGMIAASYAVSTLTDKLLIIGGFALVWGFIILTIDRAMLATYRAFVPAKRKFGQFCLRMLVAVLMGVTVSHPLTLLLFKDTIHSEIERSRMNEMKKVRESMVQEKQALDQKIQVAAETLQRQQQVYQDTLAGAFLQKSEQPTAPATNYQSNKDQFADLDGQIKDYRTDRDRIQKEYNQWVKTYEDEVSGRRTGRAGIGPAARAIETDELVWRRDELKRLSQTLATLTQQRTEMSAALTASQSQANAQIAASRRQVEQQTLSLFKEQQGQMLSMAQSQIDAASAELERLRGEAALLTSVTEERIKQVEGESRADLMTQTLALHHLFEKSGGGFALSVYLVLAGLFVLIDTIPLVVKFFAVPGIYDERMELKERTASGDKLSEMNRMAQLMTISDVSEIDDQTFKELTRRRDLIHSLIDYQPKKVDPNSIYVEQRVAEEGPVASVASPEVAVPVVPVAVQQTIEAPVELPPMPQPTTQAAAAQAPQQGKFQSLRSSRAPVVEQDGSIEFLPSREMQQPTSAPQPAYDDNEVFFTGPDVELVEMEFEPEEEALQPGFAEMVIENPQERQRIMAQLQAN